MREEQTASDDGNVCVYCWRARLIQWRKVWQSILSILPRHRRVSSLDTAHHSYTSALLHFIMS